MIRLWRSEREFQAVVYGGELFVQAIDSDLAARTTVPVRHRSALPLKALETLTEAVRGRHPAA